MTRELMDNLRRTETLNEELRRRNGQLLNALDGAGLAGDLIPIPDWPTHYAVIDKVVDRATALAIEVLRGGQGEHELDLLCEAVEANRHYWEDVADERARREEIAARAKATRLANKAATDS